jgi:hypothetical protein
MRESVFKSAWVQICQNVLGNYPLLYGVDEEESDFDMILFEQFVKDGKIIIYQPHTNNFPPPPLLDGPLAYTHQDLEVLSY